MNRDRTFVTIEIALGVLFVYAYVRLGLEFFSFTVPEGPTAVDRLLYAIQWDFIASIALFAGVAAVMAGRFFTASLIDGSSPPDGSAMAIHKRYLQNTLEQYVLMVMGHLALTTVITDAELKIIPILATLFLLGRGFYWVGYLLTPIARVFGFAASIFPIVGVYVELAGRLF